MSFELTPRKKRGLQVFRNLFNLPELFEDFEHQLGFGYEQEGVDLSEDDKNVYVKVALPGLKSDQIDVTLENGTLQIKGEKLEEENNKEEKNRKYYKRSQSSFWYQLTLPAAVEQATSKAEYKNGILELKLPKLNKSESKRIKITD